DIVLNHPIGEFVVAGKKDMTRPIGVKTPKGVVDYFDIKEITAISMNCPPSLQFEEHIVHNGDFTGLYVHSMVMVLPVMSFGLTPIFTRTETANGVNDI